MNENQKLLEQVLQDFASGRMDYYLFCTAYSHHFESIDFKSLNSKTRSRLAYFNRYWSATSVDIKTPTTFVERWRASNRFAAGDYALSVDQLRREASGLTDFLNARKIS